MKSRSSFQTAVRASSIASMLLKLNLLRSPNFQASTNANPDTLYVSSAANTSITAPSGILKPEANPFQSNQQRDIVQKTGETRTTRKKDITPTTNPKILNRSPEGPHILRLWNHAPNPSKSPKNRNRHKRRGLGPMLWLPRRALLQTRAASAMALDF